jgi:hypothetical protein
VAIFTLQGGPQPFREADTNLKMQLRCLACFPTAVRLVQAAY